MRYNELTRRHFERPSAVGVLTGPGTRRGAAGSRTQGTWVQFDVQIDATKQTDSPGVGTLRAVRFHAFGCPHVIAVADWLAIESAGRSASPMLPETVAALQVRFEVPADKRGRLLIVEDAWIAALSPQ